jgi:hypothetical protein
MVGAAPTLPQKRADYPALAARPRWIEYDEEMSGWGRVSFLIGIGTLVGVGCGGRTGALEGDYGSGADNTGASGGSSSVAGHSSHAGSIGTTGGSAVVPSGGYPMAGGAPSGYAGSYPVPVGGYGYGGYGYAGSYPVGGYGYGGYGYAGYPTATGGAVSYGGYATGGYATGGTFGYAGSASVAGAGPYPGDCATCLRNACAPPLVQCLQDFGCLSILGCMQSSGCQAFQCYSDQYCKDTIDQWGGPGGQSMQELLQTFSCAFQAGCQCN